MPGLAFRQYHKKHHLHKEEPGMIKNLRLLPLFIMLSLSSSAQSVGIFDDHGDVGKDVMSGSAVFIPAMGQYVISGAGYNVWADHDEFQFVWKKMKGDFILNTRAEFLGTWVD